MCCCLRSGPQICSAPSVRSVKLGGLYSQLPSLKSAHWLLCFSGKEGSPSSRQHYWRERFLETECPSTWKTCCLCPMACFGACYGSLLVYLESQVGVSNRNSVCLTTRALQAPVRVLVGLAMVAVSAASLMVSVNGLGASLLSDVVKRHSNELESSDVLTALRVWVLHCLGRHHDVPCKLSPCGFVLL